MLLRQIHAYVGALIAPSVLFFALTGALQLFSLHEAHGDYQPPPIVERLARLHKDQVFSLGRHRRAPPSAAAPDHPRPELAKGDHGGGGGDRPPALKTYLLKGFFLVVALGLAGSTALGAWIGLTRPRGRGLTAALLAIGALVPILLLVV